MVEKRYFKCFLVELVSEDGVKFHLETRQLDWEGAREFGRVVGTPHFAGGPHWTVGLIQEIGPARFAGGWENEG